MPHSDPKYSIEAARAKGTISGEMTMAPDGSSAVLTDGKKNIDIYEC